MASNDGNNSETGSGTMTMLKARLLIAKNGVENLSSDQKDLIVGAVARDVDAALVEARHRWVKRESLTAEQSFKLNITDFESAGDRGKSGYSFNITLENGKVTNNISGSAVARDLFEALKEDETIKAMLQDKAIKISVGKSFLLSIKTTHISAYKEA